MPHRPEHAHERRRRCQRTCAHTKFNLTSESRASGPCRVDVDNHGNGRTQRPLLSRMPDSTAVTCAYVRSYLARMYCIEVWIPRRTCRRCLLPLLVALRVGMPVVLA